LRSTIVCIEINAMILYPRSIYSNPTLETTRGLREGVKAIIIAMTARAEGDKEV